MQTLPRNDRSDSAHGSDGGAREAFQTLRKQLEQRIVGQPELIERLLLALLADGHLLVEGAPGLAKTKAIKTLADAIEGNDHRIQFTPDLLPADLTGTEIYQAETGTFRFQQGPIFHNLVLADEINRAPAKVQSALLEAMQEQQVSIGGETFDLPQPFLVMATQNPIEQEGTYPLPEAQLDRFLMHIRIGYPNAEAEREVLRIVRDEARNAEGSTLDAMSQAEVFAARREVLDVHLSPALEEYMIQLVLATRDPSAYGEELAKAVEWGASPRGTIAMDRCSRAHAWLDGRDFVTPDDVHAIAHDVLRHRVLLTFEAEAEGMTVDGLIDKLLSRVPLP